MEKDKSRKRHWLLPVLCFMTFAGSGFGIVVSLLSVINIKLIAFTTQVPGYTSVATNTFDSHISYAILKTLLYGLSITGAFLMLKSKRRGFYLYTAAQILLPLISFLFFPYPYMHVFSIVIPEFIFAIAFISLYALHLKSFGPKAELSLNKEE